jgi:hypothetical protein
MRGTGVNLPTLHRRSMDASAGINRMHPATKNFPNPGKQKERQSYLTKPFFAVLPVSMSTLTRRPCQVRALISTRCSMGRPSERTVIFSTFPKYWVRSATSLRLVLVLAGRSSSSTNLDHLSPSKTKRVCPERAISASVMLFSKINLLKLFFEAWVASCKTRFSFLLTRN